MELEFDKEIDTLLRKARSGTSAAVPKSGHLDPDAIAAFAEGAIPAAIRQTYTAHLADCDSCRKALSQVALLNEPVALKAVAAAAAAPMAAAPAPKAGEPWPPNAVPWYRPLFRSPGLAAAFGVLVLAFGGVLVYFVTQPRSANDSVAMQADGRANASIPYAGIDPNTAANSAAAVTNSAAPAAGSNAVANTARSETAPANTASSRNSPTGTAAGEGGTATGSSSVAAAPPPATAAPPAAAESVTVTADKPKDEPKSEDRRDEKETARNRALSDDALARGADSSAKKVAGPTRGAGPVQNQMQMNTMSTEMAVTRKVGGKTFHNANGAWYDNAYHGQSTTNIRRGTDEFKKLDGGLRSIANELGGVVVVVWKEKAYRIQ